MKTPHAAKAAGCGASEPQAQTHPDHTDDRKTFANLQAAYALQGYALHRLSDGLLLVERWGYSRTLDTLTQAVQFLSTIGGRHG